MPRRAPPDAIALLKEDHRKVEDLFEKFDKARKEERKQALARATTSVPAGDAMGADRRPCRLQSRCSGIALS